jgi:hypothetical protein
VVLNNNLKIKMEQGKAIQFISIDDESEEFFVTDEAMAFLASIPRDK